MGIQLGSIGINDIYIGNTNIKKVLLGSTLVYEKAGTDIPANEYIKNGLFAYYDLTKFKLTDTTVTDLSGNGHTMEASDVSGCTKTTKGGLNTNARNTVIANYNMGFTPTNATLEWFGMPNQVNSAVFGNRCCGAGGNNGTGYFVWIASNVNKNQALLLVFKNNTKLCETTVTATIPNNTPSHFVVTFGDSEFKVYINGDLVHTGNCNSNAGTNTVYLLATTAVNYNINHTLFSARMYSRVLSEVEIKQNRQYEINKYNGN